MFKGNVKLPVYGSRSGCFIVLLAQSPYKLLYKRSQLFDNFLTAQKKNILLFKLTVNWERFATI